MSIYFPEINEEMVKNDLVGTLLYCSRSLQMGMIETLPQKNYTALLRWLVTAGESDKLIDYAKNACVYLKNKNTEIAFLKADLERANDIIHPYLKDVENVTPFAKTLDKVLRTVGKTTAGRQKAKNDRERLLREIEKKEYSYKIELYSMTKKLADEIVSATMDEIIQKNQNIDPQMV
jgi:predicted transcriptional regulator